MPHRPIQAWAEELKTHRFCCACGQVAIHRAKPEWQTKCGHCYMKMVDSRGKGKRMLRNVGTALKPVHEEWFLPAEGLNMFCMDCGNELEKDRVSYALARTEKGSKYLNECKRCTHCSKGWTKPCEKCGVKHPDSWLSSPNH